MSEQSVKSIPSGTGTFAMLQPARGIGSVSSTGGPRPAGGNSLPQVSEQTPDLEAIAQRLNVATQSIGRDLRFQVDLQSGRSVIHVLDRETGEIIRQIPPEKVSTLIAEDGRVNLKLYDELV